MLQDVIPKLPMRNKIKTLNFYQNQLGFEILGDYDNYLLIRKDKIELHFFEYKSLNPNENDGQVYIRVTEIENLYKSFLDNSVDIHQNGHLDMKPWGQKEFSLLDPDNNLLTFGQST